MGSSRILEYILRVKDEASAVLKKAGKSVDDIGTSMIKIGAAPAAALAFATKTAIDFEDSLADVRKTTGATDEELKLIGDSLLDISTTSRTSAKELTQIAVVGGQIGIATKDVVSFTKAIDKVVVALSDEFSGGAEEVTEQMGKLRNLFSDIQSDQIDQDILHIANAVNELGASGLATGGYVAEASRRIAGISVPLGMMSADVLGLSATMEELGFNVERGSSAVVRTLQLMAKETEAFADVANMSLSEFEELVNTDINQAFIAVLDGINKINPSATEMAGILDDLQLSGVGNAELFLKMASNTELLAEKQNLATEAIKGTDSIMTEFNTKNETTAAQVEKMSNNLQRLSIILGESLLPAVNNLLDRIIPLINKFDEFAEKHPGVITGLLAIFAALLPLGIALKTTAGLIKNFKTIFMGLKALNTMIPIFTGLGNAVKFLGTQMLTLGKILLANPIILAITAIIIIIYLLYRAWTENWLGIQEKTTEAIDSIKMKLDEWGQKIEEWKEGIKTKFEEVKLFFQELPGAIGSFFENIYTTATIWVEQTVTDVVTWFMTLPERIAYALGFALGTVVKWGTDVWEYLSVNVPLWIESIGLWFSMLPERIWVWLVALWQRFVEWGTMTWEYLSTSITEWLNNIEQWFAELPGRIWVWLVALYTRFVQWGTNVWNYLSTNIPIWFNQVVEWVKALPGRVWTALSELYAKVKSRFEEAWEAIVDEVSGWPGKLLDWGERVAQAFVDGIKQGLSNLKNAFMDGFNAARGVVEGQSPPKEGVFKDIDKWGYNVGQAWIDGFKDAIRGLDMPAVSPARVNGFGASQVSNTTQAPIYLNATINNDMDAYELAQILGFELEMRGRG